MFTRVQYKLRQPLNSIRRTLLEIILQQSGRRLPRAQEIWRQRARRRFYTIRRRLCELSARRLVELGHRWLDGGNIGGRIVLFRTTLAAYRWLVLVCVWEGDVGPAWLGIAGGLWWCGGYDFGVYGRWERGG